MNEHNTRDTMTDDAVRKMDDAIVETLGIERTIRQDVGDQRRADDIAFGFGRGYESGFIVGAASIDRVEIVEKFEKVKESIITHIQVHDSCHDHACPTHQKLESALAEMDAVIAAMEKGK